MDELDDFMRRTIAERNIPQDTWFVFRSLKDSVVPKEHIDGVVKKYVTDYPKAAVITARLEIVPVDRVWITSLAMDTVEELRYIEDHELH